MNVVMVHGFADSGRLFRVLCRELGARGHACRAPTFHPRSARLGIPDLSEKLDAFIGANVASGSPLALVGFSMGALVARHYLQARGGARLAKAFFSIAGPHHGTPTAYLIPGLGTRQMRPNSPFLQQLNSQSASLGDLPVFTYRTPLDLTVFPAATTRLPRAEELVVWCPMHFLLPADPDLVGHVAGELAKLDSSVAGAPPPALVVH